MIPSDFNYKIIDRDKVIFFNGIKETYFVSSLQNSEYFDDVINHPDDYVEVNRAFVESLFAKGFIKNEDEDEDQYVAKKIQESRQPGVYSLMILPTYQCNLRCWYCIQNHQTVHISEDTIERIKKRIVKKCHNPDIRHIRLSWFGGEPLLEFETVRSLTEFARIQAAASGKTFICDITTNATLLNPERIDQLHEAGEVVWNDGVDLYAPISESLNKSECVECKYFPLCTGPCPVDRAGMLRTEGRIRCKYKNKEMEMEHIIKGIVFSGWAIKFKNQNL